MLHSLADLFLSGSAIMILSGIVYGLSRLWYKLLLYGIQTSVHPVIACIVLILVTIAGLGFVALLIEDLV